MWTRKIPIATWVIAFCLFTGLLARADDSAPPRPSADALAAIVASLKWQTGTITIKDGLAKFNLTDDFRFLGSDDARKVPTRSGTIPTTPNFSAWFFPRTKARSMTIAGPCSSIMSRTAT
jgi:hypothetical protein